MATITDMLLKANVDNVFELKTSTYKSKRLAELLGSDTPIEITISEIPQRKGMDIIQRQIDKNGNIDFSKSFDTQLFLIVESVVDPDLRDKDLQSKFKCRTPKELAEVMFGREVNELSQLIMSFSGLSDDEKEDEQVKN
jgi:Trk K+ transport system NAD-binding subunit